MDKEIQDLFEKYSQGVINQIESRKLEVFLKSNPENQKKFLSYLNLDAGLRDLAKLDDRNEFENNKKVEVSKKQNLFIQKIWQYSGFFSLLFVFVLFVYFLFPQPTDEATYDLEKRGVAVLTKNLGAFSEIQEGDSIYEGELKIREGVAEIQLLSGVQMIVSGPAKINLLDSMSIELNYGSLNVNVPIYAQGFTIHSENFKAVDYGTEFNLSINKKGEGTVKVLDGHVDVHLKGSEESKPNSLFENDFLVINDKGEKADRSLVFKQVVLADDVQVLEKFNKKEMYALYERQRKWIQSHPELMLFYEFYEKNKYRKTVELGFTDRKNPYEGRVLPGLIVGSKIIPGRFDQTKAIRFGRTSDFIKFRNDVELQNFTILVRLKIYGLYTRHPKYMSIFTSKLWKNGGVDFHINKNGSVGFSNMDIGHRNFVTGKILSEKDFGNWIHLAIVVEKEKWEASFYKNGEPVNISRYIEKKDIVDQRVIIQDAYIGNWGGGLSKKESALRKKQNKFLENPFSRSLNGEIESFTIIHSVLSPEEIAFLSKSKLKQKEVI